MNTRPVMKLTASAILAVSAVYFSVPAMAETPAEPVLIAQAGTGDTGNTGNDGNGSTTATGADSGNDGGSTGPGADFNRLDLNSDGHLDSAELRGQAGSGANLNQLDTNGDGRVSMDEFNAYSGGAASGADRSTGNSTITAPKSR